MCRRTRHQKGPHSMKSLCCSCCSNAVDSELYEAVNVEEATETADKCEGVEPDEDDVVDQDETVETSDDEGITDIGVSEQRKYWKTLCEEFLVPYERARLIEHRRQLVHISNGSLLVFSLVNILWFIVDFGFLLASPLGFASLTLFTAILIIQFIAMLYHRLMTASYELSRAYFVPKVPQEYHRRELSSIPGSGYDRPQNITNASA